MGGDRRAGTQLPGSSSAHARGVSEEDRLGAERLSLFMVAKLQEGAARAAQAAKGREHDTQASVQIEERNAAEEEMLAPLITPQHRRLAAAVETARAGYEQMQHGAMRTLLAVSGIDSQGNKQELLERLKAQDPAFLGTKQ